MVVVAAASADCVPSPDWVCSCVVMMVAAVVAALVVAASQINHQGVFANGPNLSVVTNNALVVGALF